MRWPTKSVAVTFGRCDACDLDVAVCGPESMVLGNLRCPWCGEKCAQPSALPPELGLESPFGRAARMWEGLCNRVRRDGAIVGRSRPSSRAKS